jgi:hypothetical protein
LARARRACAPRSAPTAVASAATMPPTTTSARVTPSIGAATVVVVVVGSAARAGETNNALAPTSATTSATLIRARAPNGYFTVTRRPQVYGTVTAYAVPLLATSAPHGVGTECAAGKVVGPTVLGTL